MERSAVVRLYVINMRRLLFFNNRFGDAVLAARQATWSAHPGANTWGAYQCYGDPGFRLQRGDRPAQGTADPEFFAPAEFVCELRNLAEAARVRSKEDDEEQVVKWLRAKVDGLLARVPAREREKGAEGWMGRADVAAARASSRWRASWAVPGPPCAGSSASSNASHERARAARGRSRTPFRWAASPVWRCGLRGAAGTARGRGRAGRRRLVGGRGARAQRRGRPDADRPRPCRRVQRQPPGAGAGLSMPATRCARRRRWRPGRWRTACRWSSSAPQAASDVHSDAGGRAAAGNQQMLGHGVLRTMPSSTA